MLQGQLPCKIYPELLGVLKSTVLRDKREGEAHSLHHQPPLSMTVLSHVVRNLRPRAISVHAVKAVTADLVEKKSWGSLSSIVLEKDRLNSDGIVGK